MDVMASEGNHWILFNGCPIAQVKKIFLDPTLTSQGIILIYDAK